MTSVSRWVKCRFFQPLAMGCTSHEVFPVDDWLKSYNKPQAPVPDVRIKVRCEVVAGKIVEHGEFMENDQSCR